MSTSTTTNYGWTIPNDDELVKNGAAAIRTLGQAIDTTAAASFVNGLQHINTTSFSAVASQSLDNVLTATYDDYLIRVHVTAKSTGSTQGIRLRASSTDASGSDYDRSSPYFRANSTVVGGGWGANTSIELGQFSNNGINFSEVKLFNPAQALITPYMVDAVDTSSTTNQNTRSFVFGYHDLTTAYDGITVITNTGTITGTISVFGYRK